MALSFNQAIFAGNLTRDPEVKDVGENRVVKFSIAQTERYGNKEYTVFIDCEAWNKTADFVQTYFTKGKPIFVVGRLKQDNWEDQNGNKRSKIGIKVESVKFTSSAVEDGGSGGGGQQRRQPAQQGPSVPPPAAGGAVDDEPPF